MSEGVSQGINEYVVLCGTNLNIRWFIVAAEKSFEVVVKNAAPLSLHGHEVNVTQHVVRLVGIQGSHQGKQRFPNTSVDLSMYTGIG